MPARPNSGDVTASRLTEYEGRMVAARFLFFQKGMKRSDQLLRLSENVVEKFGHPSKTFHLLAASECDSAGDLNIARRRHGPFVPLPEGAAVDVGVESGQRVIVPEVERLRAELEIHALRNANVFGEREIMIPVAESAMVRNARAASKIGPRPESFLRLEGRDVDERLARVEIALILRPRTLARQDAGDAGNRELAGHVAEARTEGEGSPGTESENVAHLPASDNVIDHGASAEPSTPPAEWQVVDRRE